MDNLSADWPKKTLIVIAGIALAILSLELVARLLVSVGHPPRFSSAEFDRKYDLARKSANAKGQGTIIAMGTSRSARGIYPELLSGLLKREGYRQNVINLACYGTPLKDEIFLLKTALKAGVKPSMILFDVGPEDILFRTHIETFSSDFSDSPGGQIAARDSDDAVDTAIRLLNSNFYLLSYRQYLKTLFVNFPQLVSAPNENSPNHSPEIGTTWGGSDMGWSPGFDALTAEKCNAQIRKHLLKRVPGHHEMTPRALTAYLTPLENLCAKNEIPLVLVWMPRPSQEVALFDKLGAATGVNSHQFLAKEADNKRVFFIDLATDDEDYHFSDFSHLNAAGAIAATHKLADALTAAPIDKLLGTPVKPL